jgi:ABC-2 type transport system permease protein
MLRYLKITFHFWQTSFMQMAEYRGDFFTSALLHLLESVVSLILIGIIFTHVSAIGDWNRYQVFLLNLTFTLTTSLTYFLFVYANDDFAEDLNKGNIDKYLTKPIDIQYQSSFSKLHWHSIFQIVGSFIAICYILFHSSLHFSLGSFLSYILLVVVSVICYYSINYIFVLTIFLGGRISNIGILPSALWDLGKMPTSIYGQFSQILLSTILPVGLAATVPVGVLTQIISPAWTFIAITISLIFLVLSRLMLLFAIRNYSSASS